MLAILIFAACSNPTNPAGPSLTGISVTTQPTKIAYKTGEGFTAAGLVVTVSYSDGSSKTVTVALSWNSAPLVNGNTAITATTGTKTITVTYEGETATFDINVSPPGVTLIGISVTTQPIKIAYTAGEAFTMAGLTITASYSDDSTVPYTAGYTLSWNDADLANGSTAITATAGTKTVTVTYEGKTATFNITVSPPDTTPPTKVTGLSGDAGDGQVTLTWTDPTDTDLDHIEITWAPGGTTPQTVAKGTGTYTAMGLTNGTAYTFTVRAVDASGNKSGEEKTGPHTPADTTPPAKVTGLTTTPGNGKVRLTWTDPADADLISIEITFTPMKSGVTQPISVPRGTQIAIIEGLDNSIEYIFTVKAKDATGNPSGGETTTAEPKSTLNNDLTPPGKVTGLNGTSGDRQVTLTWTDPTDTDLGHIEITWTPGGTTPQAVAKGIGTYTTTNLTNGIEYTFTVKTVDNAAPTPNKSEGETKTFTLHPAGAKVTVNFTGLPQDESITMNATQSVLSWSADTPLTVSVDGDSFSTYKWVLDGAIIPGENGSSFTGSAGNFSVKKHELTVFVFSGGVEYAKTVTFTVTL